MKNIIYLVFDRGMDFNYDKYCVIIGFYDDLDKCLKDANEFLKNHSAKEYFTIENYNDPETQIDYISEDEVPQSYLEISCVYKENLNTFMM